MRFLRAWWQRRQARKAQEHAAYALEACGSVSKSWLAHYWYFAGRP